MTPSLRAAIAGPASFIVREQKGLNPFRDVVSRGDLPCPSELEARFVCCRAFVFKGEPAMFFP